MVANIVQPFWAPSAWMRWCTGGRQRYGGRCSIERFHRSTRPVCRQLERRHGRGEFLHPPRFHGFAFNGLFPLALRLGIFAERHRSRELTWLAIHVALVQLAQLVEKHVVRPAIADDVVRRDQEHVEFDFQLDQLHAHQRAVHQIEWLTRGLADDLLQSVGTLADVLVRKIDQRQLDRNVVEHSNAVVFRIEGAP